MAGFTGLSDACAILLATHYCASGNVSPLPALHAQFSDSLPVDRLLRIILTFLPESIDPQTYTPVLQALADGSSYNPTGDTVDISAVKDLSEATVRKRVRKLRLLPLKFPDDEDTQDSQDLLTQFLVHRAHRIDSETSLQPLILELLLPFYQRSPALRTFLVSCLLPLLRLNYEYYPNQEESFSLETLESLDDHTAINALLSMTGPQRSDMDLIRNLRGLIGPWMYGSNRPKRQRFNELARQNSISISRDGTNCLGWRYVNEWLLSRSLIEPEAALSAFVNWDGPEDVDLGGYATEAGGLQNKELKELRTQYAQTGLAVVYASSNLSLDGCLKIVERVASFVDVESSLVIPSKQAFPSVLFDADQLQSASRALLLQNALLLPTNPLTSPSHSSISFISALLVSLHTLHELGHPILCRTAANICLHNSEDMQLFELRSVIASIVKNAKPGRDWTTVRQQLLWLRDWKSDHLDQQTKSYHGLFWRTSRDIVDADILKAMLEVREYELAANIYMDSNPSLKPSEVENAVKEAIFAAYDNASNGNRNRGKMQKAYEILQAFQTRFPNSTSLKQAYALISATHSLSFYSLTLQHGVPFQPVSIRVHPDPISLIEKVLDQNPKSYTKLDDLLGIGRNLVTAGFSPSVNEDDSHYPHTPTLSQEDAVIIAERRIMSLAIASALHSNDFSTAYSYILTRLTPPSSSSSLATSTIKDDITWRAVYNAGRYRASTTSPNLQAQITHLSQRIELLSLALVLASSPDPLPEILGAWRRCDEELSILRARETEEEEIWDARGDSLSSVPGGFGPTDNEQDAFETKQHHAKRARAQRHNNRLNHDEAPMGLFEVARGAAMALHKNAFPLRASGAHAASTTASDLSPSSSHPNSFSNALVGEGEEQAEGRVRKRDVVSNMVTGGLASGIGWVLGAQPVNR